ncbi:MAG: cysteine--tRNA ligase [Pseudomonadota bacterium]
MTDQPIEIRLRNSKSRRIETLQPMEPGKVSLYLCGPTVYDRAHIGNARSAVALDLLFRLLRHVYGAENVTFVRNFTDIDDKINARAAETGRPISDITAETSGWYLDDLAALGVLEPNAMPRATDYIAQMVAMIEELVTKGHAYEAEGHVLFSVASDPDYGSFAGRSIEDMIAGARVEVAPYKRDAMDFVLWKPSGPDLPGWDSPWGRGRPGWHIECSAMAADLLGPEFDIHAGGSDLQFPHHENEMAQSRCVGHGMARIWLHNEMLQVEGRKMSKSLGNFFTVRDLLDEGVPGEVIRLVLLGTQYRKTLDWTEARLREAEGHLRKWRALTEGVTAGPVARDVLAAVADDLNSAGAIAALHAMAARGDAAGLKGSAQFMGLLTEELGGWVEDSTGPGADLTAFEAALSAARAQAMQSKDFTEVDRLKTALTGAGLEVRMSKTGIELVAPPGFDPAALAGIL